MSGISKGIDKSKWLIVASMEGEEKESAGLGESMGGLGGCSLLNRFLQTFFSPALSSLLQGGIV